MEFDFIVIGGGSAGYAAARTALQFTSRVAVIDGARELGGLCILRGCMPSKTLIHSAHVLHQASLAKTLGLHIPEARVDMPALAARKKRLIGDFAAYRRDGLESGRFTLLRTFAHFVGPNELELADGRRLTGKKILVATGSQVNLPEIPGLADIPLWTSDDVLDLDFVPESVLVLGAGTVGCELAQFLRRIGSKVIVVQRSEQILKGVSPEAARVVETAFADEGIELFTGTAVSAVRQVGEEIEVTFACRGQEVVRRARHCFNALGRRPDTEALRLDLARVLVRPNGRIVTNEYQQSTNPDVYAAGDCASPHEIVHIAVQQGEVAARHAFGADVPAVHYDHLLQVIFTDPQVATAGATEAELKRQDRPFLAASYPFNDHGKSILMEANYGYVKVLAEPEHGKILGAEIVGHEAAELIHCFSVALTLGASVFDLLRVPWYHPTLAEIFTYPLEEIAEKIQESRPPAG